MYLRIFNPLAQSCGAARLKILLSSHDSAVRVTNLVVILMTVKYKNSTAKTCTSSQS